MNIKDTKNREKCKGKRQAFFFMKGLQFQIKAVFLHHQNP